MKNNKIKDIILFTLIAMYFASNILIRNVSNLDELWNYNFASNIANGLIPYKDFNMVVTPLLSFIGGIFLRIFGKEIIVIRILNILLSASIIFMMYKIMEGLQIKRVLTYLLLIILSYVFKEYAMFDYNFAIALVSLMIVYLEIRNYENNKKNYQIIIGILSGICITLKQTTGIIITLALLGYKILDVRNKQELKQYLKMLLWRIVGIIIPVVLMIIYLSINNAFYDFIDYCILGVSTFLNKISYISRLLKKSDILIKIFSIMPISLLGLLAMYIKKRDKHALILFVFGIVGLSVVYPISDETHLIPGIFIIIIGLGYILNNYIKKDFIIIEKFLYIFTILIIMYQVVNSTYIYLKSHKNTELLHYKGIIMTQNEIQNNIKMGEYIKSSNKKVYILDFSAAYYMIPINRYNKNYDMFNVGNLGSKGEQGQIEKLEKEKNNIKVLIKNHKHSRNWQNPEEVRKWVIGNMSKTGQIGMFDIYE